MFFFYWNDERYGKIYNTETHLIRALISNTFENLGGSIGGENYGENGKLKKIISAEKKTVANSHVMSPFSCPARLK